MPDLETPTHIDTDIDRPRLRANPHPSTTEVQHHSDVSGELTLTRGQKRTDQINEAIERLVCAESAIICVVVGCTTDLNQRSRLNVIRGRLRAEITVLKAEREAHTGGFLHVRDN